MTILIVRSVLAISSTLRKSRWLNVITGPLKCLSGLTMSIIHLIYNKQLGNNLGVLCTRNKLLLQQQVFSSLVVLLSHLCTKEFGTSSVTYWKAAQLCLLSPLSLYDPLCRNIHFSCGCPVLQLAVAEGQTGEQDSPCSLISSCSTLFDWDEGYLHYTQRILLLFYIYFSFCQKGTFKCSDMTHSFSVFNFIADF